MSGIDENGRDDAAAGREPEATDVDAPARDDRAPDDASPLPEGPAGDLVAFLDGELDDEAARRVERALAADPALRAERARLEAVDIALDDLEVPPGPPVEFVARLRERIASEAAISGRLGVPEALSMPKVITLPGGLRIGRFAAAAVVLLAVGIGALVYAWIRRPDGLDAAPEQARVDDVRRTPDRPGSIYPEPWDLPDVAPKPRGGRAGGSDPAPGRSGDPASAPAPEDPLFAEAAPGEEVEPADVELDVATEEAIVVDLDLLEHLETVESLELLEALELLEDPALELLAEESG